LNKIMKMANHPYDKTKWGEELKDLEVKWLADVEDDKLMLQCSCSS
jgi:serine/tyrosine/threonine adenylyltransferase